MISQQKHNIKLPGDFCELSYEILNLVNQGLPRVEFFTQVTKLILAFSGLDEVELRIVEQTRCYRIQNRSCEDNSFNYEISSSFDNDDPNFQELCLKIFKGETGQKDGNFTAGGSFCAGNTARMNIFAGEGILSLAVYPLKLNGKIMGLLILKSRPPDFFFIEDIEWYEDLARIISIAINFRNMQVMHRKRVKELTCYYNIAKLSNQPELSLDEILQSTVELLPPGWLYPETAQARIVFDDRIFLTADYKQVRDKLTADIFVNNFKRGFVEVIYTEQKPKSDESPFLREERNLLNTIAQELGFLIERSEINEEKIRLKKQLLHADRLATIGQLAAGIAHEINEPLSNILGFAQLSQKIPGLPEQVDKDLKHIVESSLYARDVIKKLLMFARQTPSVMEILDLNTLIEDSLELFSNRFTKEAIKFNMRLYPFLPRIKGDHSQLNQVLVNLIVNAVQAMPKGGELTIETFKDSQSVFIAVSDTGVGMSEEVRKQIFLPFFTTKDMNQGTGLGLSVVHGIVTGHQGKITVESEPDKGSTFTIELPIL